jgi:hypothetical protein
MSKASDKDPAPEIPPQCYQLDKVPHDWLFPQIDAALHHGGAGTTGASLRAGIPTLIKPWFGDQWFVLLATALPYYMIFMASSGSGRVVLKNLGYAQLFF